MEQGDNLKTLIPLTHPDPQRPGKAYQRLDRVEAQIAEALSIEPAQLIDQASILDFRDSDFLQPECLVYLIRKYHSAGNQDLVNSLISVLLKRCAKHIDGKTRWLLDEQYVKDCFDETVATIFTPILDLSSDQADFAQVRFWVFLKNHLYKVITKYMSLQKQDHLTESLDTGFDDSDRKEPLVPDALRLDGEEVFDKAAINQALDSLSERHRTLLLMRYCGWEIDSKDPKAFTISKYFNCSERTIRRWLEEAEKQLHLRLGD